MMIDEYDEASLVEALSSFSCGYDDADSLDVERFLKTHAIENEKMGISRTYLMMNDAAWEMGVPQIDGYFSIALKTLWFNQVSPDLLEDTFGKSNLKNCPAFLIGQLARSVHAPKGAGESFLKIALSYIASASELVGGRFVYLDCNPNRQAYYERQGFSFLQQNKNYIQMYKII